jgi:hypothetical protein
LHRFHLIIPILLLLYHTAELLAIKLQIRETYCPKLLTEGGICDIISCHAEDSRLPAQVLRGVNPAEVNEINIIGAGSFSPCFSFDCCSPGAAATGSFCILTQKISQEVQAKSHAKRKNIGH